MGRVAPDAARDHIAPGPIGVARGGCMRGAGGRENAGEPRQEVSR